MAAPANILLIRIKSIGDVLLTLPAVAAIRENYPAAKITFLTSLENAALLRGFSNVDEVIALDREALRSNKPWRVLSEFAGLLRRLRAGKFDLVLDFQGNGETSWLARFTGASQRWGSVYNPGQGWAYTRRVTRPKNIHPAETNLELLRQCGLAIHSPKNEFMLPADALADALKYFADNQLDSEGRTCFSSRSPVLHTKTGRWKVFSNLPGTGRHMAGRSFLAAVRLIAKRCDRPSPRDSQSPQACHCWLQAA